VARARRRSLIVAFFQRLAAALVVIAVLAFGLRGRRGSN
jgi:hypothetical protein